MGELQESSYGPHLRARFGGTDGEVGVSTLIALLVESLRCAPACVFLTA